MRHVHSIPFLRITIAFILGILLFKFLGVSSSTSFVVLFIVALFSSFAYRYFSFEHKLTFGWINGIVLQCLFVGIGFLVSHLHTIWNKKNWYRHHITATAHLKAKILTPLKTTERTYKANAEIEIVCENKQVTQTKGEVILYFQKGDGMPTLAKGDEILLVNKLNPIIKKGNPGEFDYAQFCQTKGIYDQAFLTPNEWSALPTTTSSFSNPFDSWHESIKSILTTYIPDPNSLGIAKALLTGYRDDIDKEVYNEYSKTGLVHLLAISGLHMGIFYLGAQWLLGLIPFFKKRKRTLIISSLLFMWLFALLTTFPPSVQRASIMFTFLGIGQLKNRRINSLQFLFLSAFVLLLFKPSLLWDVGFQLSYAAVLGILLFYKPLRKWYYPDNKILKKVWEIMCISLAAQIFTFPLALYYFHQLPTLFLFTNIIAIPLVTLIIYGEVLLIIFSFIEPLATLIGKGVSYTIFYLNSFIHYTASIPFVSLQNIKISLPQFVLLEIIVGCFALWFLGKRKVFAPIALACLIGFFALATFEKNNQLKQNQLIIYNANTPFIEYIHGNNSLAFDSVPEAQQSNFNKYTLLPSHLLHGVKYYSSASTLTWKPQEHFDYINIRSKNIIRIKKAHKLKTSSPIKVDYLIISDKWIKNVVEMVNQFNPAYLIIDGNIPLWKIEDLKSQLREVNLPTHYIGTDGAKIISL